MTSSIYQNRMFQFINGFYFNVPYKAVLKQFNIWIYSYICSIEINYSCADYSMNNAHLPSGLVEPLAIHTAAPCAYYSFCIPSSCSAVRTLIIGVQCGREKLCLLFKAGLTTATQLNLALNVLRLDCSFNDYSKNNALSPGLVRPQSRSMHIPFILWPSLLFRSRKLISSVQWGRKKQSLGFKPRSLQQHD